ncbi:MAG: putative LPS assembly protein LptD, partial [Candidatus Latescibacterota bacterium]
KDHVHYDFLCQNVRVLQNDQAVGRSVTFRIGPVPIFWLPFFIFPTKQGRQSGILTPSIGSNDRDGIFARNIGYYYAPSDYWDATLKGTIRERGGFLVETRFVYAIKNRLSGSMDVGYDHSITSAVTTNSWRFNMQHQQRINATTNMRGTGQFTTSSTFNKNNSDELYTYLNQQLRSSFSIDKRWNESGRSIDGSLTYYRDLEKNTNQFQGFPRLSFRQGSRALFDRASNRPNQAWYHAIRYDINSTLTNTFTHTPNTTDTRNLSVQSGLNLNSQHKPLGWLDLSPRISLNEQLINSDADSITRRENYTASLNVGTSLYGIFQTNIGRIKGFRHRLQPRISINYNQNASLIGGTFGFGGTRNWDDPRRSLNFGLN